MAFFFLKLGKIMIKFEIEINRTPGYQSIHFKYLCMEVSRFPWPWKINVQNKNGETKYSEESSFTCPFPHQFPIFKNPFRSFGAWALKTLSIIDSWKKYFFARFGNSSNVRSFNKTTRIEVERYWKQSWNNGQKH